jgi:hypothetical protein
MPMTIPLYPTHPTRPTEDDIERELELGRAVARGEACVVEGTSQLRQLREEMENHQSSFRDAYREWLEALGDETRGAMQRGGADGDELFKRFLDVLTRSEQSPP